MGAPPSSAPVALGEVSLKASYDYPFIDLSRELPTTPISMWCLWSRELLQVPSRGPAILRHVEKRLRRAGHVIEEWADGSSSRIFLLECACSKYDSLWNVIEANQCWDAPPVIYRSGWAYFRLLAFEAARTRDLYRDLRSRGPAELVRKRELPLSVLPTSIYSHTLFGGLMGRQASALLTAQRRGYYTSPRPTTTESIAASLGLGRSTYEELLRKAENRVMAAMTPYLELFEGSTNVPQQARERTSETRPPTDKDQRRRVTAGGAARPRAVGRRGS
jgi:predicted DNA binding protein